ncbi:predicted protein [Lichtheimia corymbifera JMRC:FSU:9682]|uniref:Spindle assembly checkpoint component MAD1 n=1 Tax=Lichtheimia corymbifera JMRC:FSU:9682 TaxID=1263082 RepID=A0A068SGG0_9FUNG|nr:predicted protein [Lichtheimia corymbifera JMRC:FSU:9682]
MSNDDRPRITRELVYRNVSRSPNKAMDHLVEDDKSKRITEAIEKLRKEIKAGDLERDKLKASFKLERQDLSLQLEALIKQNTEAKERAVYHMNQYNDAASKLQLIKDEHASIANKLRRTIQDLRDENGQLNDQIINTQRQYEATRDRLTQVENQMQYEMQRLQTELDCLKQINEHHEQSNKEYKQHLEELFAEDQPMDDKEFDAQFMAELDNQCKQQAKVIEQLEKKNIDMSNALDQYRQRYPDLAKLDEEQHRIDRELKEAERIRQQNVELKVENDQLKAQAAAWTKYLESESIDKYSSPQEIVFKLSTGRAAMREAEIRAEKLERELEERNAREEEQTKMLEDLKSKLAESEQARKRDMLEKESLSKDKKMLEIHRDLLEHQLTVISKVEEANASTSDSNDFPLTQRLAELETLLKEHQQELSSTRAQLAEAKASIFTGRILELKSNPASMEQHVRQEQLESLRLENRQLLKELFEKDNGQQQPLNGDHEDTAEQRITVPRSTIENLQTEAEALSAKIASREKRILRLQQVFATKFEEIDHVIQSLLGYSMDFRSDGTVRVCSTSVHESELVFLFKSGANDEVNFRIVGSMKDEYMQRLQGTYDTFVHEQHNIPAFLSSVTLELMNSVGEDQGYGYESQEESNEDDYYYDENNMEAPGNTEDDAIMIDD